jgi:hypothetical protein
MMFGVRVTERYEFLSLGSRIINFCVPAIFMWKILFPAKILPRGSKKIC